MAFGPARACIIDTDPGLDDAIAILFALASPEFDVRAITTVAGNIGLRTTTWNAGRLLAVAGRRDIPVHAGAAVPLARPGIEAAEIHGGDGMGGVVLPEPFVPASSVGAVDAMAAILMAEPAGSVDILALGPLTNVALLLHDHPEAGRRIGRLIAMGGAIHERGNVGPRSEFNFAVDPEAAKLVLGAGLDSLVIPLDVTRKVRADRAYVARLAASSSRLAQVSAEVIEAYFHDKTTPDASRPLHDPCVMLAAIRPDLFGVETLGLTVSTVAGPEGGTLDVVACRPVEGATCSAADGTAGVRVAMRVDSAGALDLLAGRLELAG